MKNKARTIVDPNPHKKWTPKTFHSPIKKCRWRTSILIITVFFSAAPQPFTPKKRTRGSLVWHPTDIEPNASLPTKSESIPACMAIHTVCHVVFFKTSNGFTQLGFRHPLPSHRRHDVCHRGRVLPGLRWCFRTLKHRYPLSKRVRKLQPEHPGVQINRSRKRLGGHTALLLHAFTMQWWIKWRNPKMDLRRTNHLAVQAKRLDLQLQCVLPKLRHQHH